MLKRALKLKFTFFSKILAIFKLRKHAKVEGKIIENSKAENIRKLILATSKDIRVLLVKIADRLHNMRTLDSILNENKRKRIA